MNALKVGDILTHPTIDRHNYVWIVMGFSEDRIFFFQQDGTMDRGFGNNDPLDWLRAGWSIL